MKTLSKLQQLSFIIRREFLAISTSYAVLLVLMGGIFVYGLLYNYMYAPNIVTDVPVAVVDNSHSELSRDFIRWLDATPQAEISSQAMDYHEAKEWMKEGKVQGILYLPHDFEERVFRGDELCVAIKSDIEISHIPVLLLTALGEENNILDGLSIGADEYLIKPFSVKILRANIANLLANRELLRMRYANLDIEAKSMVPSANGTNSLDWKFISNAKKIVDENINNPEFSVDVLCESSGMSRTSFYCKLKALTGQSPTEFIRVMRLKRATELLKEGRYAINEISDMVGFSETKYFREVFKKYYKMSPSRYAKEGGNPSAELEDDEED